MHKNGHEAGSSQTLTDVSADRLQDLLSTSLDLRRDGQLLISRIRGSLDQMRQLRSQLKQDRGTPRESNGAGANRGTYLQARYGLTTRESEVALLLAQGRSNSAVAAALHISTHTARHHTQRVLTKLGVHSRAEAGRQAPRLNCGEHQLTLPLSVGRTAYQPSNSGQS